MRYENVTMTNEDAQYLDTRQFQRNEICALFRVPPHEKLSDAEKALMETVVEWKSRRTYPSFLKKLGITATMSAEVEKYGYAYPVRTRNFDALVAHLGIKDEKLQTLLESLSEVIRTVPPNKYNEHVSKLLRDTATDIKGVPIEKALRHIRAIDFAERFLNATTG